MKYAYAVFPCKTCSKMTPLKYLGEQPGKRAYALLFPPIPIFTLVAMRCQACGSTHDYIRTDIQCVVLDQAPPSDFVDQIPTTEVVSKDFD